MSASVKFKGNAGNHMFQYITALVYCVKYNIQLDTQPTEKMLKILKFSESIFSIKKENPEGKKGKCKLTFRNFNENDELTFKGDNYHYIFTDFFQNSGYLNNNYDIIKQHVFPIKYDCTPYLSNYKNIQENDILFIIRLGDFKHQGKNSEIIHPNYFLTILKNNKFSNIYILIHPSNDKSRDKYLGFFNDYKEQIILLEKRNELIDFNIIKYFKNIAITNSTFNWWSVFFEEDIKSKKIFTPKLIGYCGIGERFKCHGAHVKNLYNIRNTSIPIDNEFINLG